MALKTNAIYREIKFKKQLMPKKDKSCDVLGCEKTSKCIKVSH
jgi:hypothetical protein